MKLFSFINRKDCVSNKKKKFEKIFSSFFFKHLPKKKVIRWTLHMHCELHLIIYRVDYVILFSHKIQYVMSFKRDESIWAWAMLGFIRNLFPKQRQLVWKLNYFVLVGTLINNITIFGFRKPTRDFTESNASITCDCLVQLEERRHYWAIFLWIQGGLNNYTW